MSERGASLAMPRTLAPAARYLPRAGVVCLVLAVASTVFFPVTLVTVALAAAATAGLAFDRRLGPLPAALLVTLALPYDRAANMFLPRVADIPIRPQDAAIAVGALLTLPYLRLRPEALRTPQALGIALFLVVGLGAFVIGFLGDNAARDILRDARWWALYGGGLLAILGCVSPAAVVRAFLVGPTVFAVTVIVVAALPAFEDALKIRSLTFDSGLLRMQFGNTTIMLVTIAAAVVGAARTARPRNLIWVGLLLTAAVLSLTRVYIVVAMGVVLLAIVAAWLDDRHRSRPVVSLASAVLPGIAAATGVALAVGIAFFSLSVTGFAVSIIPDGGTASTIEDPVEDPLDRLLLQSEASGLGTLGGGRFETYRRAALVVAQAPLIGSGLGTLVEATYSFGGEEFDTPGFLPNVDDAWLTVGMKAGVVGIVAFGLMLAAGFLGAIRARRWLRTWLVPAWLGLLALTIMQSFATTGYGPFALGLLIVLPALEYAERSATRARPHE